MESKMRTIVLILCIILLTNLHYPQEEVKRKDGKIIIINDDGTWNYKTQSLTIKKQIVEKLIAMKKLTQTEVNECGGVDKVIPNDHLQEIDLNKDKNLEFILYGGNCRVYDLYIFRKIDNKLEIIFEGWMDDNIEPLQSYTNGWLDLRFSNYSSGTGESGSEILHWNGSKYK